MEIFELVTFIEAKFRNILLIFKTNGVTPASNPKENRISSPVVQHKFRTSFCLRILLNPHKVSKKFIANNS